MPIYEYQCEQCGEKFEYLAKRLSDKPAACPECNAETLKKLLSTFSPNANVARMPEPPACSTGNCPTGTCCPTGGCSLS